MRKKSKRPLTLMEVFALQDRQACCDHVWEPMGSRQEHCFNCGLVRHRELEQKPLLDDEFRGCP